MNEKPLISVIIPVYNGARFLPEAIQSVVDQNYPSTEIIIIDDGSTDDTPAMIVQTIAELQHSISIRSVRHDNQGSSASRNVGILNAMGDFIAFLDVDDLHPPDKFAAQLQAFEDDPTLDLVAGRIQYISLEGAEERDVKYDEDNAVVHVHLGSMLTRRRVFDRIGFFDPALRYSEDVEWWLRIREVPLNYLILNDITLQYRLHDQNMTRGVSGIDRPFMEALKKSLARRRASGQMHLDQMSSHKLAEDKNTTDEKT